MASFYKAAIGHDIAALSLVLLNPQPTSDGVQVTRRTYSGNRTIYDEGKYTIWRWNVVESEEQFDAILDYFGLDGPTPTAEVTINAPEAPHLAYNRWNGIAHQPQIGENIRRREYFLRDLEIYITDLEYAL